jgi:hypothetical protein
MTPTATSPSPLFAAVVGRLDKIHGEPVAPLAPGNHGPCQVTVRVEYADGTTDAYAYQIDDVRVGAPTTAAPTAAALTVAGVARMLATIEASAGAVARHVRRKALAALLTDDGSTPPADVVEAVEEARAAARASLPPITRTGAIKIVTPRNAPAWRRV